MLPGHAACVMGEAPFSFCFLFPRTCHYAGLFLTRRSPPSFPEICQDWSAPSSGGKRCMSNRLASGGKASYPGRCFLEFLAPNWRPMSWLPNVFRWYRNIFYVPSNECGWPCETKENRGWRVCCPVVFCWTKWNGVTLVLFDLFPCVCQIMCNLIKTQWEKECCPHDSFSSAHTFFSFSTTL